jgi:hypothetical protein
VAFHQRVSGRLRALPGPHLVRQEDGKLDLGERLKIKSAVGTDGVYGEAVAGLERETLFAELKKIYRVRSNIVHGATDLTIDGADQLHDQRLRATAIGAQTLRTLLGPRHDLLTRKADARSTRLLPE